MRGAVLVAWLVGCASGPGGKGPAGSSPGGGTGSGPTADAVAVRATGAPGAWTFAVTIRSDETGCDQYADWWEVLSPQGELLYRRILNHSHPDEQPFTRDGGPVPVDGGTEVLVRAHLHPLGYVGATLRGTVDGGFEQSAPDPDFAAELASRAPLPESCWF